MTLRSSEETLTQVGRRNGTFIPMGRKPPEGTGPKNLISLEESSWLK